MHFLFFCTVGVSTYKEAFVGVLSYFINKGVDFLSGLYGGGYETGNGEVPGSV